MIYYIQDFNNYEDDEANSFYRGRYSIAKKTDEGTWQETYTHFNGKRVTIALNLNELTYRRIKPRELYD